MLDTHFQLHTETSLLQFHSQTWTVWFIVSCIKSSSPAAPQHWLVWQRGEFFHRSSLTTRGFSCSWAEKVWVFLNELLCYLVSVALAISRSSTKTEKQKQEKSQTCSFDGKQKKLHHWNIVIKLATLAWWAFTGRLPSSWSNTPQKGFKWIKYMK